MRLPFRQILSTIALLGIVACASSAGSGAAPRPRGQRDLLTREQIESTNYSNVFEVVQALRSNWLSTRGTDTLQGRPSEVLVYLDNSKVGGIQNLRAIQTSHVEYIRYYDGISATQRWGLDHGAGVIFVSTRGMR